MILTVVKNNLCLEGLCYILPKRGLCPIIFTYKRRGKLNEPTIHTKKCI
jgi:hypothetical protein